MLSLVKGNMNSDILLETAAIFFLSNLFSKTLYWQSVRNCWVHFHGLTREEREPRIKNKKSCPQWNSNSRPLDFEVITVTFRPWVPSFYNYLCYLCLHLNERQSSCIQYCSHITSVSFCCLKNIYWTKKERYIKFSLQLRIFHLNIVKVCTVI